MRRAAPTSPILHPFFLGALSLLAVNDHILKERWPGLVTGKLSDLAGPVVIAIVVAVLTRHRSFAVVATGVGFAALKLSPHVAGLAAPLLGGVTANDPTDLIGLVALVPTYRFLGRFPETSTSTSTSIRPPPESDERRRERPAAGLAELARSAGLVAIGLVTTFSVTATSCVEPPRVAAFFPHDEGIVAEVQNDSPPIDAPDAFSTYYLSSDGGRSWLPVEATSLDLPDAIDQPTTTLPSAAGESSDAEADFVDNTTTEPGAGSGDTTTGEAANPVAPPDQPTEACLDNGRCFRVEQGTQVAEQIDGSWQTTFRFTEEDLARMELRTASCGSAGTTSSFGTLIAAPSSAEGESREQTVVVSMGEQGALRLDPTSDEWERVAIGGLEPISTSGPRWLRWLLLTPLLTLALSPLLMLVNRKRSSASRRAVAMMVGLVCAGALLAAVIGLFFLSFGTFEYESISIFFAVASVIGFLVSLAIVLPRDAAGPPSWPTRQ